MPTYSIVIPCKNEQNSICQLLDEIVSLSLDAEIIVVDDGSSDDTPNILSKIGSVTVITHPYSKGNGASIKSGARQASGDVIVFMDADGQHQPKDIKTLISVLDEGFDMVIGARNPASQASNTRRFGNKLYNWFATYITGHKVLDLTSGFRAVKRDKFMEFLSLLPNGFSYPTTISMAFFRAGYSIKYLPITMLGREGNSHLSIAKDGLRFLLIIFRIGTLYSPLKIYVPFAMSIFLLGLIYYFGVYFSTGRFTNMALLLFVVSIFVFIFGLISEQITNLIYLNVKDDKKSNKAN